MIDEIDKIQNSNLVIYAMNLEGLKMRYDFYTNAVHIEEEIEPSRILGKMLIPDTEIYKSIDLEEKRLEIDELIRRNPNQYINRIGPS